MSGVSGHTKRWQPRLDAAIISGTDQRPLHFKHKRQTAYTDKLEVAHPSFIRELYRYTEKTLGKQASINDLARTMNKNWQSKSRDQRRPS